jgi:acyl carrier protein
MNATIEAKLTEIINSFFLGDEGNAGALPEGEKLHILLSESSQALELVTTIEDEFEIEFDDDEVDLAFFTSFELIVERIKGHLGHPAG